MAIVAAAVVGYGGGKLLAFAKHRDWTSDVSEQIAILALAPLAYEGSVWIGGNGFVGGILFGAVTTGLLKPACRFTETIFRDHETRHDHGYLQASTPLRLASWAGRKPFAEELDAGVEGVGLAGCGLCGGGMVLAGAVLAGSWFGAGPPPGGQ